jgi:hypothetical protein
MSQVRAVGIPWYRREDYAGVLAMMEDADVLPDTWEDWFKIAKNIRDQKRREGFIVEQVTIDPSNFKSWCTARGLHVNAEARMAFANEHVYLKFGATH